LRAETFSEERPPDEGMTYHVVHQDLQADQDQGHRGQAGREPNLALFLRRHLQAGAPGYAVAANAALTLERDEHD